ncbi:MAG: hypothetical protein M3Z80_08715 [Apibacter sp.]|uniref:hypothetical protein n=1 Tax=Apibacter sp. TaxID=2023709 RepID=UPI0025FB5C40|nr:hypothetical protein [Apibacter sp.]MCT6870013.1 hypothetical protein [Apibacter sp.]
MTLIEFQSLQAEISYKQAGNALKNCYLQKIISVIDLELTLLEARFIHPERFVKDQTLQ